MKVTSGSIVIQARDSTGNPVTMFIGPHWAAEKGTAGSNQQTATTGSPTARVYPKTHMPAMTSAGTKAAETSRTGVVWLAWRREGLSSVMRH